MNPKEKHQFPLAINQTRSPRHSGVKSWQLPRAGHLLDTPKGTAGDHAIEVRGQQHHQTTATTTTHLAEISEA